MTTERAIQILDPNHREHYESIEPVNEACRMGVEALKRSQWISVKSRLPMPGEDVVVYSQSSGICIDYINATGDFDYQNVTHWMPLPEPPSLFDLLEDGA